MMRRYGAAVFGLALVAGCMTEPTTKEVEQGLADCNPGKNFPNAKLGPQLQWNGGQPVAPGPKEGYVIWQDAANGPWNAVLANPSTGTITVAYKVQNNDIGPFLAKAGAFGRIDVGRTPPPPPPVGTGWMARYALEFELRVEQLHDFSLNASQ